MKTGTSENFKVKKVLKCNVITLILRETAKNSRSKITIMSSDCPVTDVGKQFANKESRNMTKL